MTHPNDSRYELVKVDGYDERVIAEHEDPEELARIAAEKFGLPELEVPE